MPGRDLRVTKPPVQPRREGRSARVSRRDSGPAGSGHDEDLGQLADGVHDAQAATSHRLPIRRARAGRASPAVGCGPSSASGGAAGGTGRSLGGVCTSRREGDTLRETTGCALAPREATWTTEGSAARTGCAHVFCACSAGMCGRPVAIPTSVAVTRSSRPATAAAGSGRSTTRPQERSVAARGRSLSTGGTGQIGGTSRPSASATSSRPLEDAHEPPGQR